MKYLIIERNTDYRCPEPKIHKFSSLNKALKFKENYEIKLSFPESLKEDVRPTYQNSHHRILSDVLEPKFGFSLNREVNKLKKQGYKDGRNHSCYWNEGSLIIEVIYNNIKET